jgi:hypothetical protein
MFLVVVIIVALLAAFSFYPIRYYRRVTVARIWPRLYWVALICGAVLGIFGASHHHENAKHTRRYIGYPMPYAIFALEDGEWIDYVPGVTGFVAGLGGNFFCGTALLVSPFSFYCLGLSGFRFYAARKRGV